jgi:PHP family Zn ribbon phosphoesterase
VEADFGYRGFWDAVRSRDPARFLYTVEFFPEEGKYHHDGHRPCGVRLSPRESRRRGGLCPVCGRRLTLGVLHRIEDLADRPLPRGAPTGVPFLKTVPLEEILGQVLGRPAASRLVREAYFRLIRELGDEHRILTEIPAADLERIGPPRLGWAVERVRRGKVRVEPGGDGVYGRVSVLPAPPRRRPGMKIASK